jgi:hypothetical protein
MDLQAQATHPRFSQVNLQLTYNTSELLFEITTANMLATTLLATLALAAGSASAAPMLTGTAEVHNKCDYPVYVTSVSGSQKPTQKILPGHSYYEPQSTALGGVGVAIKITKSEGGLYRREPVTIFGYSYNPQGGIYYSLGYTPEFGYGFQGEKLRIHNTEGLPVQEIVWNGEAKPDYTATYLGDANLTLELCDDYALRA